MNATMIMKRVLGGLLSTGKAFFNAAATVAWGIAGFFLMTGFMVSLKSDPSTISGLFTIIQYIQKYWAIFFIIIFFYEVITNYGDFFKAIKKEETKEIKKEKPNGD